MVKTTHRARLKAGSECRNRLEAATCAGPLWRPVTIVQEQRPVTGLGGWRLVSQVKQEAAEAQAGGDKGGGDCDNLSLFSSVIPLVSTTECDLIPCFYPMSRFCFCAVKKPYRSFRC